MHLIREHYPTWSKARITREAKLPKGAFLWKSKDGDRLRNELLKCEKYGATVTGWRALRDALEEHSIKATIRTLQRWEKSAPMRRDANGHPTIKLRDLLSLAKKNRRHVP